jgi:hypothetical protein
MTFNPGGGWMGSGTQADPPASTHAGLTGEELRAAQDLERQGGEDKDKAERDEHNAQMA